MAPSIAAAALVAGIDLATADVRVAVAAGDGRVVARSVGAAGPPATVGAGDLRAGRRLLVAGGGPGPAGRRWPACDGEVVAVAVSATSGTVVLADGGGEPVGPALLYDDSRAPAPERWDRLLERARRRGPGRPRLARLRPRRRPPDRHVAPDRLEPRPQDRVRPRRRPVGRGRRRGRPAPRGPQPDVDRRHRLRRGGRRHRPARRLRGAAGHDRRLRGPDRRRRRPPRTVRHRAGHHAGRQGRQRGPHRRPGLRRVQPPPPRRVVAAGRGVEHRRRGRWRPGSRRTSWPTSTAGPRPTARRPAPATPSTRTGERFPFVADDAEGLWTAPAAGPVDEYRAVLEGVAFVERLGYERLGAAGRAARRPPPQRRRRQPERRVDGHPGDGARRADHPAGVRQHRRSAPASSPPPARCTRRLAEATDAMVDDARRPGGARRRRSGTGWRRATSASSTP